MQIENNKEEVPFSFYEGKFRELDPADAVARLGDIWDGKEFYVNLLGKGYAIAWPEYGIREVGGGTDSSRSFGMTGEGRIPRRDAPRNDRADVGTGVLDGPLQGNQAGGLSGGQSLQGAVEIPGVGGAVKITINVGASLSPGTAGERIPPSALRAATSL